jgi:hypothetical protein
MGNLPVLLEKEYTAMIGIVNRLEDYSGYKLVKEDKKINLKIYSNKEEGQRLVSIKFDV